MKVTGIQITSRHLKNGFDRSLWKWIIASFYHHLKNGCRENASFADIVTRIFHLARQCISISYSFMRRNGNSFAHKLAKLNKMFVEIRVWVKEMPFKAYADILSGCSNEIE